MNEERNTRASPGDSPSAGEISFASALSEPGKWAVFLDIDGTLIDLAETPLAIVVPPTLPADLAALSQRLGGALALVTGRSIALADALFAPHRFAIAGLHGAEWRQADGEDVGSLAVPASFQTLKRDIAAEAAHWPGVVVEDKGAAVAVHYRLAPDYKSAVEALMVRFSAAMPGWALQHGKMVVELRPARASKGKALEAFLAQAPFKGRLPLAIGDDLTDEAMFESVNRLGGRSIRIGAAGTQTHARALISSPAALRALIARCAA